MATTPAPSSMPIDRRQLGLDIGLTVGIGLLVVGGRLLTDGMAPRPFVFAGLGAFVIAGSLFGREVHDRLSRGLGIVAAVTAVACWSIAIVV